MFTIAQITDFHVSTPDSLMDVTYRTARRLELAVQHLNDMAPRPDIVLATGDLVDRGKAAEYAIVRQHLDTLAMPYFVIPGNHDSREEMRSAFADGDYFEPGSEYLHYAVDRYPLRLVGLDTVIPRKAAGTLCQARLDWLDATLAAAPERPTVVFMHHPPLRSGIVKMDAEGFDATDALAAVLARYPQVEAVLCGHLHRAISRRMAGTMVTTCPSVSHQLDLDLSRNETLSIVLEPPACMLHVWYGPADGLVSHQSYIGGDYQRVMVFDGKNWLPGELPSPLEL